jgi:hypothetical protein
MSTVKFWPKQMKGANILPDALRDTSKTQSTVFNSESDILRLGLVRRVGNVC